MKIVFVKSRRAMPLGTISKGMKKVAQGKWVPEHKGKKITTKLSQLTPDDIKRLKTNKVYRDKVIEDNQKLIGYIINKDRSKVNDIYEAQQNANVGFLNAINKFDLKKNPTGKGFATYVGLAIRNTYIQAINKEMNQTSKNISTNMKLSEEGKELEETIEDVKEKEATEKKEREIKFGENLALLKEKVIKPKAKQVLDLLIEGYSKVAISQRLKMSKMGVTQIVKRDIAPHARKILSKTNEWEDFIKYLEEF